MPHLPKHDDVRDAELLFYALKLYDSMEKAGHHRAYQMFRAAIDNIWDKPRETRIGSRMRLPNASVSPAAAELIEQGKDSKALVMEHVIPMHLIVKNLILKKYRESPVEVSPEWIAEVMESRFKIAFITEAEDKKLSKDFKTKMPEGWDPEDDSFESIWGRYIAAGLDPTTYKPYRPDA